MNFLDQKLCYWSSLTKLRSSWWIDFFADLLQSGILDMTNDIHKEALWFCFADVFQTDLDKAKQHWNSHRIRKSHETTVPGVPEKRKQMRFGKNIFIMLWKIMD